MKRKMSLIPLVLIILMLANGCTKEVSPQVGRVQTLYSATVGDNALDISDIRAFADKRSTITKTNGEPGYTLEPYCGSDGEPLVYIVNYGDGDGWQILSTDARTPAVIAEGDSGYFSLEDGSPAVRVWLDCMATDIAAVKRASDDQLNFSEEEIAAHRAYWGKATHKAPVQGDRLPGHWEVDLVGTQQMVGDTLDHMTPHWDQWEPYNFYCPFKTNSTTYHKPAGCVALAASEVLYYTHYKLAVPDSMVSYAYYAGDKWHFEYPSTTVWAQMDPEYQSGTAYAEAKMIGHVGDILGMSYHDTYSWAIPANIRTLLFPHYRLTCDHGEYDEDVVKSNLENLMPVIVTASDLLIPADFDIHCFVIDGFKKTFTRSIYYHHWETNDPYPYNPRDGNDHSPYYTYSDSPQVITSIKINWGWWTQWQDQPVNDGWYSLTANWTVTAHGDTYSYNYILGTIYDIAALPSNN